MKLFRFHLLTLGLTVCLGPAVLAANLVNNGSFESNLTGWTVNGTASGVAYSLVMTSFSAGTKSMRTAGRVQLDNSVRQNLLTALNGHTNGTRFVTRFMVNVPIECSVRCRLQLLDGSGSSPKLILAEKMVRATNTWVEVVLSTRVAWTGTLTGATLLFEVGQMVNNVFPDFLLDDISMKPDSDGDQIADEDEATYGTHPNLADTDGDGLPDGWEVANQLNPLVNDAAGDADNDTFTNHQEYWAATNPSDASSAPGKTTNPNANATARAVLKYLALLPSQPGGLHAVGQHLSYPSYEYVRDIAGLEQVSGKSPAVLALQYDDNANPLQISTVNPFALQWWTNGGLVQIKWSVRNPWSGGFYSNTNGILNDLAGLLNPSSSLPANQAYNQNANNNLMAWLDEAAAGLNELRTNGVVVLWRPISEMNGGWFWWGSQKRENYIGLWRFMHDYFTRVKGLDNLIWVYESDASVHPGIPADYYYPGDDVVDVMTHNLYSDTWVLSWESDQVYRHYPKPQAVPQAGSQQTRDGTWDNLIFLDGITNRLPRLSYFCAWSSFTNNGFQVRAIVGNPNASNLMNHPLILTRDTLNFAPVPALAITTAAALPGGTVGVAYGQTLTATGGTAPYAWSVSAGTLPAGVTLSATGVLAGTPTAAGSFNFTVQVADNAAATATKALSLVVQPPSLVISSASPLPGGTVGASYQQALTVTGGSAPYSWSVIAGALPGGVTLNPTGTLAGTPTTAGTNAFTLQVTDAATAAATKAFTLIVLPPPLVITTPATLPDGIVGTAYQHGFGLTGGTPPYGWQLVTNAAPAGLAFLSFGELGGTPLAAGTVTFTVRANDNAGVLVYRDFTITIQPPPVPDLSLGWLGGHWQLQWNGGSLQASTNLIHWTTLTNSAPMPLLPSSAGWMFYRTAR